MEVLGRFVIGCLVLIQHLSCIILIILPDTFSEYVDNQNSSLLVFNQNSHGFQGTALPHFLSAPTSIQVEAGQLSILQCRVTSLSTQHTVSWIRVNDVSVLTVGNLVFSSDPRVGVVSTTRPGHSLGSWTLSIQNTKSDDGGSYQCQVNTEPPRRKTYSLQVSEHEEVEDKLNVEFEYSEEHDNDDDTVIESDEAVSIVRVSAEAEGKGFKFSKVEMDEQPSTSSALERRSEEREEDEEKDDVSSIPSSSTSNKSPDLGPPTLMIPVLSLFCITILVLALGSIRGLYKRCGHVEESQTVRNRSRKYSGGSNQSRESAMRRQRKSDREDDHYESFHISPLIEVIEATPTTNHPGPAAIFSLTSEKEASVDSDYSVFYNGERSSNLSVHSSNLSGQSNNISGQSSGCSNGQYSDLSYNNISAPIYNASTETLDGFSTESVRMQPVGSILCGPVRLSIQREVEDSPAYLPTNQTPMPPTSVLVSNGRQTRAMSRNNRRKLPPGDTSERRIRFQTQDQVIQ